MRTGGGSTTTATANITEGTVAAGLKKGPWTPAEDAILVEYVRKHGEGNWNAVQKNSGLQRCGKSCRLRWANHLRPNLKKGAFSPDEELLILRLHSQLGNKWARMAAHLPGRTDNEIKNYWNTRIKRRQRAGLPLYPPELQLHAALHAQQHRLFPGASPPPLSPTNPHFPTSSPLTLLDPTPIGFHTSQGPSPNALYHHSNSPEAHRIKRLRDEGLGFHLNFPSSPSPLYQTAPQSQHPCIIGNFDLDPVHAPVPFSAAKMELPSTQLLPESTGSGLLDAMLQEEADSERLRRDALAPELGIGRRGDSPQGEPANKCSVAHVHPTGGKLKRERPDEETKTVSEDLASLLDMISTVMPASATSVITGWCNDVDSGEQSNEQSSVITEAEEFSLEMQQLTSSLSVEPEGGDGWNLGSCSWDTMRGIC